MSEAFPPAGSPENPNLSPSEENHMILGEIAFQYLNADDVAFLDELDDDSARHGYVYGRLLELGEEPDQVFEGFGWHVSERDEGEEQ